MQSIYLDHCTSVPTVKDRTFNGLGKDQKITVFVKDGTMKTAFEQASGWNDPRFTFEVKTE